MIGRRKRPITIDSAALFTEGLYVISTPPTSKCQGHAALLVVVQEEPEPVPVVGRARKAVVQAAVLLRVAQVRP